MIKHFRVDVQDGDWFNLDVAPDGAQISIGSTVNDRHVLCLSFLELQKVGLLINNVLKERWEEGVRQGLDLLERMEEGENSD